MASLAGRVGSGGVATDTADVQYRIYMHRPYRVKYSGPRTAIVPHPCPHLANYQRISRILISCGEFDRDTCFILYKKGFDISCLAEHEMTLYTQ